MEIAEASPTQLARAVSRALNRASNNSHVVVLDQRTAWMRSAGLKQCNVEGAEFLECFRRVYQDTANERQMPLVRVGKGKTESGKTVEFFQWNLCRTERAEPGAGLRQEYGGRVRDRLLKCIGACMSDEAYNYVMKYMADALIVGVTLLWCASPARADEAGKSAKAEELLQLTQSDQMMKQMLEQIKMMQTAQMKQTDMPAERRAKVSEMQEKLMALVADGLNKAKPALVKIYADTYTEEEMDGILAFYKSPPGKAMLEKMPQVMKRSTPVMIQMMSDLQPEMKKVMEEMKQKPK